MKEKSQNKTVRNTMFAVTAATAIAGVLAGETISNAESPKLIPVKYERGSEKLIVNIGDTAIQIPDLSAETVMILPEPLPKVDLQVLEQDKH